MADEARILIRTGLLKLVSHGKCLLVDSGCEATRA